MENFRGDKSLKEHLKHDHKISRFGSSLKEIVYGGIDGIVTTFAVVCGFVGASSIEGEIIYPVTTVLLFGLANLFADGFSMGLGDFISSRSNNKFYEHEYRKELKEVRESPNEEKHETVLLLMEEGFNEEDSKQMTEIMSKNESFWVNFMMQYEIGMNDPGNENPIVGALVTFVSFLIFGSIPLIPYIFGITTHPFMVSIGTTALALTLLGYLRKFMTKENMFIAIGEVLFIGSAAASIAYFVGFIVEKTT